MEHLGKCAAWTARGALRAVASAGLVLLAAAFTGHPVAEQTFDEAMAAYKRGDYTTAFRGFLHAAEQGNDKALFNLEFLYFSSEGVPQDYVEAATWYRRVAEQGPAFAQFSLGLMYYNGQGVPRDYGKAHMWLDLATLTSFVDTDTQERWRQARDAVAQLLSPEDLARAQRMAREWRPKGETQSPPPKNAGADGDMR